MTFYVPKIPITVWERYNKTDDGDWVWEHNHISDGHQLGQKIPLSKFPSVQRSWNGAKWRSTLAELKNGVVTYFTQIEKLPEWPKNEP